MSCGNGSSIKHIWDFQGMDFVYTTKVVGGIEEMDLLVEVAQKNNVSMIYTAETFNDCGDREIKKNVYGVWIQENDPNTNKENIDKMWNEYRVERAILLTGWHDDKGEY